MNKHNFSLIKINSLACVWLILLSLFISSCATIPSDYPKQPSYTIESTDQTWLALRVDKLSYAHPGKSGFYVLPRGVDALAARLMLAERAEVSIDVQYYVIQPDLIGELLIGQLLKAADRGVRVRLLLDDIQTKGFDELLAVLSSNPNLEIRITNPFSYRQARTLNFLTEFQRVNHRMHNKSITFDNAVTVFGGRNIGLEYFGASEEFNFRDFDVMGVGQVARDISAEFDTYWNAAESVPVEAFVTPENSQEILAAFQRKSAKAIQTAENTPYKAALDISATELLLNDAIAYTWANARVVYDLPYGTEDAQGTAGPSVLQGILIDAVEKAQRELFVISPYFVPSETGEALFRKLRERGVRCVVITNSLASTDVKAVYAGYAKHRKALLDMGVELWEIMAFPEKPGTERGLASERRSLHAKTFAIDRELLFVGSFNWDPRSRGINTEMGALIESASLASGMVDLVTSAVLQAGAWQLRLADNGNIEWVSFENGHETIYKKAPQTSLWRRFSAWASGLKAIEGQL